MWSNSLLEMLISLHLYKATVTMSRDALNSRPTYGMRVEYICYMCHVYFTVLYWYIYNFLGSFIQFLSLLFTVLYVQSIYKICSMSSIISSTNVVPILKKSFCFPCAHLHRTDFCWCRKILFDRVVEVDRVLKMKLLFENMKLVKVFITSNCSAVIMLGQWEDLLEFP